MHYICQVAQRVLKIMDDVERNACRDDEGTLRTVPPYIYAVLTESRRLDPRDFLPEAREEFVVAQVDLQTWLDLWIGDRGTGTGHFANQFNQDAPSREVIRDEIKSKYEPQEGEAQLAVGGLNVVCDILEARVS